jgi:hypothetical protein
MTLPTDYASWSTIANAIKALATRNTRTWGPDINTQITGGGFDRFLSRIIADGGDERSRSTNDVAAVAAAVKESGDGGPMHVRHHMRSGWPVREHSRAARGTAGGTTARPDQEPS